MSRIRIRITSRVSGSTFVMKMELNSKLLRMIEDSVGASPHRPKGRFPQSLIGKMKRDVAARGVNLGADAGHRAV